MVEGKSFNLLKILWEEGGFTYNGKMEAQPIEPLHPLAFFGFGRFVYFRRVAEAATREARHHPGLRFRIFEHQPEEMFAHADLPDIQGVIAPFLDAEYMDWFLKNGARILLYSSRLTEEEVPDQVGWIRADDEAIGAAAARHFEGMGLAHAAFFGVQNLQFAVIRERGFRKAWEASDAPRGHYCACLAGNEALHDFLTTLPRPCGIFCSDDSHARSLVTLAHQLGFQVPEDFAVVGVDHDLILSELSPQRLSSVIPDAETLGKLAVRELARCFREDDHPGAFRMMVPPTGIHYDESAPFYHSVNPTVTQALHWLEAHLAATVNIDDLARVCGVSRRNLEYLCKKHLGQGPYQQLLQMRIHLAKRLLRHSPKNMTDIADACGFSNAREFSVRFKEKIGKTPSQYREGE